MTLLEKKLNFSIFRIQGTKMKNVIIKNVKTSYVSTRSLLFYSSS